MVLLQRCHVQVKPRYCCVFRWERTHFVCDLYCVLPLWFRPEFLDSEEPYLELREVRHPTLVGLTSTEFIPNDIVLGTRGCSDAQPTCVLLTGPNMGGKSTLLRQACLAAIIAQMVRVYTVSCGVFAITVLGTV